MVLKAILGTFALLSLSSLTTEILEQTLGRQAVCDEDVAVFVCTNNIGAVVWEIRVRGMPQVLTFSFGNFFRTPFTRTFPGPSMIKGNVTYINSSFILSMVTFYGAIYLNESIINCDGEAIVYTIRPGINLLPAELILTSYDDKSSDFHSVLLGILHYNYQVNFTPPLLSGPVNITATDLLIGVASNQQYNITVSWRKCPNQLSRTFEIGRCPFIASPFSEVQYTVVVDGTYTAVIRCTHSNVTIVIGCEESGQWNDSLNFCTFTDKTHPTLHEAVSTESLTETNYTSLGTISANDKTESLMCSSTQMTGISTAVFASTIIGSNSLVLFIGIAIGTIIGIKIGLCNASKNIPNSSNINTENTPFYEDIQLNNKTGNIDLSDNVAYGHSTVNVINFDK